MACRICSPPQEGECAELNEALRCFEQGQYTEALEHALPLAERGITKAQCMVGGALSVGFIIRADYEKAEKMLLEAGEKGCALAWHNLMNLYLAGSDGIPPDKEKARICHRKAKENGFDLFKEFPEYLAQCTEELLK